MFVSMDNSLFGNNQKTLANYSLSGHPIKFCEAGDLQKNLNPLQFILNQTHWKKKSHSNYHEYA